MPCKNQETFDERKSVLHALQKTRAAHRRVAGADLPALQMRRAGCERLTNENGAMVEIVAIQSTLIPGFYRCHNCGCDVESIRKFRRWRLCATCWSQIIEPTQPGYTGPLSDELWQARENLWALVGKMEMRYPTKWNWTKNGRNGDAKWLRARAREVDDWWPFCACGRLRQAYHHGYDGQLGLWGGPFEGLCEICEARETVRYVFETGPRLVPGRDEEEWLDILQASHPEAFELGVLPDYWFELKLGALMLGRETRET